MFFVMNWTRGCRYSHIVYAFDCFVGRGDARLDKGRAILCPTPVAVSSPKAVALAPPQERELWAFTSLTKHLPQLQQMGLFQDYEHSSRSRRDRE